MLDLTLLSLEAAAIHNLRDQIAGEVIAPDDPEYDDARACFNLLVDQRPALVVMATGADDISHAVRFAADHGLDVAVQATGHGVVSAADGALLINTSRMTDVSIDPEARTAHVQCGAPWGLVLAAGESWGLAPALGSSTGVGAVGYTLGGGFGWIGRKYGLASDSAVSFEVVTADGEQRVASATENPDLFWGLRGGGGGLAIVTAMTVRLFPVQMIYGGRLIYPIEAAADVMRRWRDWLPGLPDEMSTSVKIMNVPDKDHFPAPMRGKTFVILSGAWCGPVPEGAAFIDEWRQWRAPLVDAFRVMPFIEADDISQDPREPVPGLPTTAWLRHMDDETIDTLVRYGTLQEGRAPLIFTEIHYAGGAIARNGVAPSAFGDRDSRLLLRAVCMAPTPQAEDAAHAYFNRMHAALQPAKSGTAYMNFLDGHEKNERIREGYPPETLARLAALKMKYDPANRLNRAIAIPTG